MEQLVEHRDISETIVQSMERIAISGAMNTEQSVTVVQLMQSN